MHLICIYKCKRAGMQHFSVLWKCTKLIDNIKRNISFLHALDLRKRKNEEKKKEEYKVSLVYENRKLVENSVRQNILFYMI